MISKVRKSRIRQLSDRFILGLCGALVASASLACESKKKSAAQTSEAKPKAIEAALAADAEPSAKATPPTGKATPASDAEKQLAKDFIVRFTAIIAASKPDGWLELHTVARREKLVSSKMIEQSYMAWVAGTAPVLEEIRIADFRLEHVDHQLVLTFDGTMVPNDPSAVYQMHLIVEEGELRIDEL